MEGTFLDKHTIKQAGIPADLNLTGLTGARIKMDAGYRLAVVIAMGDSVGAAFNITLQQHNAATAGTSKALDFKADYYHKVGPAATSFTKVVVRPDDTVATTTVNGGALFAADEGVIVFDILPEHLDRANNFGWVSVNISDPAAAKIFSVNYIVHSAKQIPAYDVAI